MPTLALRDLVVAYRTFGRPDARPVLFVHGLGNSSLAFLDTAQALAADASLCVVADCRGHGATSKPDGPYSIEQMADDWAFLHAALRLPAAHWVGSSMGGAIAMAAALRHPSRVRSLALVGTWARTDAEFSGKLAERLRLLRQGAEAYAKVAFPQTFGARYRRYAPEAYEPYVARVARTDVRAFEAAVGALDRHDVVRDISGIRMPTTVIVGEVDALLPVRYSEAIAEAIPGARLVRMAEVGHLPMIEAPTEFRAALLDHLRRA